MIAVDTSSLVAFFEGTKGLDIDAVREGFRSKQLVLPPVVLSETLSTKTLSEEIAEILKAIELLEITSGYWIRVGELRRSLLLLDRKARLADVMIAQFCMDHRVALITRDSDFLPFTKFDLKLVVPMPSP